MYCLYQFKMSLWKMHLVVIVAVLQLIHFVMSQLVIQQFNRNLNSEGSLNIFTRELRKTTSRIPLLILLSVKMSKVKLYFVPVVIVTIIWNQFQLTCGHLAKAKFVWNLFGCPVLIQQLMISNSYSIFYYLEALKCNRYIMNKLEKWSQQVLLLYCYFLFFYKSTAH